MAGEEKSLKKRDPIFSVCLVVFAIAAVAVLGSFVYDEYVKEDGVAVEFGDTVVVDYVGTYYEEYKGPNGDAVVFDTTYKSVGDDENVAKSNSFNKTSYSTYSVNVGQRSSLAAFEDALIGHKVGDVVKIKIPAGEGYVSESVSKQLTTGQVPVQQTMSKAQFEALYEDAPVAGQFMEFTTIYGWSAIATLSSGNVVIENDVSDLQAQYVYDEDSALLIKNAAVNGGNIEFTYALDEEKIHKVTGSTTGEIQMIELNLDGNTVFITNYLDGVITYKTCGESYNIDLYFEIKIVSIS